MPEEEAAARGNALLKIMQARLAVASTWTSATWSASTPEHDSLDALIHVIMMPTGRLKGHRICDACG